jgi:hypothetical protein
MPMMAINPPVEHCALFMGFFVDIVVADALPFFSVQNESV